MFGHEPTPTRVYSYGATAPIGETAPIVRDAFFLARRYRNALVEIERDRREAAATIIRDAYPEILAAEAEIAALGLERDDLRVGIKRRNSAERKRRPQDDPAQARLAEITARLREIRGTHRGDDCDCFRCRRRAAYRSDGVRAALDALDAVDLGRRKALRREYSGQLYWATRGAVEQGLSGIRSGAPPKFVGSEWPGKLAVQCQVDVGREIDSPTWADLLAGETHATVVRIERVPLPAGLAPAGRRSKRPHHLLHLRIGSTPDRAPVWATVRFALHRPIPEDARIKWVYLVRERVGTQDRYAVQFVVARPDWPRADTVTAAGAAGVDLGWRHLPDGALRVAVVVGEDGHTEELVLPAEQLSRDRRAETLQTTRDELFAVIRERLRVWLAVDDVPDWLREGTRTIALWRSQRTLAGLARQWRDRRFDGDAEMYDAVEVWRKQDRHLYDWQAFSRRGFRRWRLDHYRRFAARLRWRYARLIVEDARWADLMRRPAAETETDPERLNRRHEARLASPGLLRSVLAHGHPVVERAPSANTTRTCSECGAEPAGDWDAAAELIYRCANGHHLDQDVNAARNLLAAASGEVVAA
jgi:hypothetical protein